MVSVWAVTRERIQQRVAATMKQALDDTHLDRELVGRSFNTQLEALKLPPRPVIFYPNWHAATERVAFSARDAAGRAARDAGWPTNWAAARAWVAARAKSFAILSTAFLEARRNSCKDGWRTAWAAASVDNARDLWCSRGWPSRRAAVSE